MARRFSRWHGIGRDLGDDGDVLLRRQAGDQVVELEHEAHMLTPKRGELRIIGAGQVFAVVPDVTGRRHVQPAQDVQQRGLAAARRPQQHDELARIQHQIHAAQRVHLHLAHAVDLGQALGPEDDFTRGCVHAVIVTAMPGKNPAPKSRLVHYGINSCS
jgi:hypothetical protein